MDQDLAFMERALELAALARGKTSPNPMVGAVVVKDGIILGEGYHRKAGTPHAEILPSDRPVPRPGGQPCTFPWNPVATLDEHHRAPRRSSGPASKGWLWLHRTPTRW